MLRALPDEKDEEYQRYFKMPKWRLAQMALNRDRNDKRLTQDLNVKQFTVTQYAGKIQKSRQWVLKLIEDKKLKAKKFGNQWLIKAK